MTVYRVYSAEIYDGPVIVVVTYNIMGRKIKEESFTNQEDVEKKLKEWKTKEPLFTSKWFNRLDSCNCALGSSYGCPVHNPV